MADYSNINNPYDNKLSRQSDSAVIVGPTEQEMSQQSGSSSASDGGVAGGLSGGSVESTAVKSAGTLSDTWINTFLRSTNWLPRKSGFTIDGRTGYAEFADVFITGGITATTGTIGGFDIGADYIRDVANSMGLASTVTGGDDTRFWAGDTYANRATAPFRVTEAGAVTASNITITGGSIGGTATVGIANLNIANRGWIQTSVFSVTDADTVAWGAGTFTAADGTAYSIGGGNTGNMAAKTYIYLDTAVSTTAYQTTTTATTAIGAGKVLIATAQNGAGEAVYFVLSGAGGQNIDASSIVANSITANELSTSITYAGAIIIDTAGLIRSGQTAYDTGTGWFIGNVTGTPKLSIGNASGNKLTWDGSAITIVGAITGGSLNINDNAVIDSSGFATFIGVSSLNKKAYTNFETVGRFVSTVGGTGSNTFGNQGVTIAPGATATSYSILQWRISNAFTNNPTFTCTVLALGLVAASGTGRCFIGMGQPTVDGGGITYTAISHIGFKIQKDGGTVTVVAQNGNLSGLESNNITTIVDNDVLELFIKVTSTNIKYYYRKNGGTITLGATHTTFIPTGSGEDSLSFSTSNAGTAFNYQLIMQGASYEH